MRFVHPAFGWPSASTFRAADSGGRSAYTQD